MLHTMNLILDQNEGVRPVKNAVNAGPVHIPSLFLLALQARYFFFCQYSLHWNGTYDNSLKPQEAKRSRYKMFRAKDWQKHMYVSGDSVKFNSLIKD